MSENVRLVVWDLDETFWKGTVTEGGIQHYSQAHHDIVIELARRGILSSICSKNDRATILSILAEKGILDYFVFPSISWEPKGMRLAQLVETVQLRAPTVMFIDDNPNNRAEASAAVPGLQIEDETFIAKMLDDPRFKGKDDKDLTRLAQYKLLEQRKQDEAQKADSNEDFLRSCDIRVHIEYDVESHIDRAVELINRTNQLNYTKKRLPEDPEEARQKLRELMKPFDRVSGLVRVVDKYGDYGFVGFFLSGGMRTTFEEGAANTQMIHFCFSCRTLGMFVEQWVYQYLGRPELHVAGEVLTDLSIPRTIDWIRLGEASDRSASRQPTIAPRIVVYGGCEANVLGVYFQAYADKVDIHGNYVANGIFSNVNFAARLVDVSDRDASAFADEAGKLGLPLHLESGDIFRSAEEGTLFVVNFTADAHGCHRIRHKLQDWTLVLSADDLGNGVKLPLSEPDLAARFATPKRPVSDERREHLTRVNTHILENYEHVEKPSESEVVEDAREVVARIPAGARLIIIVDHDHTVLSSPPGELKHLPWVSSYRNAIQSMVAEYPFVAVMSVSDIIQAQDDILGGSHYRREVYLRTVQRIVEIAGTIAPRADAPLSKLRRARVALAQREERRRQAEAKGLVQAGFECLLRRPPDQKSGDFFEEALANGRMVPAHFVRALTGTNEFKDKWLLPGAAKPPTAPAPSSLIDYRMLRVPDELTVNATHPKRVLIVGSCLSEVWVHRMKVLPDPCEASIYLQGRDLPEQPEYPIQEYDFQMLQLALRFVLPDASFARLGQADIEGHEKLFRHAVNTTKLHLDRAMRWNREHGILTFVFPFVTPMQNPVGRLLPRYDLRNPVYFIDKLNEALEQEIKGYSNVYFFDLNEIHAFHGKRFVQEDFFSAMNHAGYISNYDFKHDANRLEPACNATDLFEAKVHELFLAAWRELVSLYRTVRQADSVKMVVIDLDDTLWRGVIAEQEADTMPTSEGWPKGFWETLLFLKRRGILLAIISKNEESRILEVWDRLVSRQLKLDDFAIRRINWRPKPENMAEILAHVNLLPGNVIYIDDNPAERASMKAAYPAIRVLGGTPLAWRRILLWSSETQVATITAESEARTDMVRAQVIREEQRATLSRDEFLTSLSVKMTMFEVTSAEHPRFARVFELVNKTNQFNTTGRRWTREECVAAFSDGVTFYAFEVADLYTEYGLVGVLIVDGAGIRQFVMSCRIMGLEAEIAAVWRIGLILKKAGVTSIFAAMVETDRNQPCRNIYFRCGFEAVDGGWRRTLDPWFAPPEHITFPGSAAQEAILEAAE